MKTVKLLLTVLVLTVVTAIAAYGCADKQTTTYAKNGDTFVFTVTSVVEDGDTLIDYMESLKGSNSLTSYTIENGMITEINGLVASNGVYWMLYTDDAENSNETWGNVTVDGVTYSSAILGAESLQIKQGCSYVWMAQQF